MAKWHIGDVYPARATFTDAVGNPVAPTSLTFRLRKPDGTVTTPVPANPSVGVYTYDIPLDQDGVWAFEFVPTGLSGDVVEPVRVYAAPSPVTP